MQRDVRVQDLTPAQLREVAEYVAQTSLDVLGDLSAIPFPLVQGNLRNFPRTSPEAQAAENGFRLLRRDAERVVAVLHALAAARENNRELPDAVFALANVDEHVEAYARDRERSARDQAAPANHAEDGGGAAVEGAA
jgi:hypothetical protein